MPNLPLANMKCNEIIVATGELKTMIEFAMLARLTYQDREDLAETISATTKAEVRAKAAAKLTTIETGVAALRDALTS